MNRLSSSLARGLSLTLVAILPSATGCSRRAIEPGGGDATGTGSNAGSASVTSAEATADGPGGETSGASGDDPAPLICTPDETNCDGECADLSSDVAHCGECGYPCRGTNYAGVCVAGDCTDSHWPCIQPTEGIATCAQACASVGQSCVEKEDMVPGQCGGSLVAYLDYDPSMDGDKALERCLDGGNPTTAFEVRCADPIDWDHTDAWGRVVVGVACCCTQ